MKKQKSWIAQVLERLAADASLLVKDYEKMERDGDEYLAKLEALDRKDDLDRRDLLDARAVKKALRKRLQELKNVGKRLASFVPAKKKKG